MGRKHKTVQQVQVSMTPRGLNAWYIDNASKING